MKLQAEFCQEAQGPQAKEALAREATLPGTNYTQTLKWCPVRADSATKKGQVISVARFAVKFLGENLKKVCPLKGLVAFGFSFGCQTKVAKVDACRQLRHSSVRRYFDN